MKLNIALLAGDGIGPEVIIKTLADTRIISLCTQIVYASTKTLSFYRKLMEMEEFKYSQVKSDNQWDEKSQNIKYILIHIINLYPIKY